MYKVCAQWSTMTFLKCISEITNSNTIIWGGTSSLLRPHLMCKVNHRQIVAFRILLFHSLYVVTYKMRRRLCILFCILYVAHFRTFAFSHFAFYNTTLFITSSIYQTIMPTVLLWPFHFSPQSADVSHWGRRCSLTNNVGDEQAVCECEYAP